MWHDRAWKSIEDIHRRLPSDATLKQREQALKDGYPFGQRKYWPYKAWLKARRQYLAKYKPTRSIPDSLLSRWK